MTIENSYDQWAESYDSMLNRTRDLDLIATQQNLQSQRFESILEVGCGTGKNTSWLSRICTKLVAVDFSEQMMAIGKQKVVAQNVAWHRMDITQPWTLPESNFELITFNLVLEHVESLPGVLGQAASRLSPTGQIHLSELHPFKQYLGSKARFETLTGTQELKVYVHHVSEFTSAIMDSGLELQSVKEWFDGDRESVPRLLTILARAC